jgi:hypothetical protein
VSTTQISLRLGGDLPSLEELTKTLGIKPTKFVRRGERVSKKRVQPVDLHYKEYHQILQYSIAIIATLICTLALFEKKIGVG